MIFGRNLGKFLTRGQSKNITLYLDGKSYKAKIVNLNLSEKHNRKNDMLQIRYSPNSELSIALKLYFNKSYKYIHEKRKLRDKGDRTMIRLPEDCKEYLAIYTTEYEDTYLLETIVADEVDYFRDYVKDKQERIIEEGFNYDVVDEESSILEVEKLVKLRKLNKKISDNLKLLYNYRCQICGKSIGEKYSSQIAETHHIEYFIYSLNNDSNNQLVVCPNHHSIIHNVNPSFVRKNLSYIYPNGLQEKLVLNQHLR